MAFDNFTVRQYLSTQVEPYVPPYNILYDNIVTPIPAQPTGIP